VTASVPSDAFQAKLATFDKLGELRPAAEEWRAAEKARLKEIAAEAQRVHDRMNRGQLLWQRSSSGNWYTEDQDLSTLIVISPSQRWSGRWGISVKKGEGAWERIEAWPSQDEAWEEVEKAAARLHGWDRTKPRP
jgi:hypothetical protein